MSEIVVTSRRQHHDKLMERRKEEVRKLIKEIEGVISETISEEIWIRMEGAVREEVIQEIVAEYIGGQWQVKVDKPESQSGAGWRLILS